MNTQNVNVEEEKGVQAIIFLQSLAGIKETREKAQSGWINMSEDERKYTLTLAEHLGGSK